MRMTTTTYLPKRDHELEAPGWLSGGWMLDCRYVWGLVVPYVECGEDAGWVWACDQQRTGCRRCAIVVPR